MVLTVNVYTMKDVILYVWDGHFTVSIGVLR